MNTKDRLESGQKVCTLHASRLDAALQALKKYIPFKIETLDSFTTENIAMLDMLTSRFAKLQDTIGAQIFPALLTALEEDTAQKSFLDILNRLEKLEILPSTQYWRKLREVRNHITHEYPGHPEIMIKNLNTSIAYIEQLLQFWEKLDKKVSDVLKDITD